MTKILYLPTGKYLKFISDLEMHESSEILENSLSFNARDQSIDKFIVYLISHNLYGPNSWSDWFININELMAPIIKEDLEIVYD